MLKQEQVKTPELNKMLAVKDKSQLIGEFLEWLGELGIALTRWDRQGCEMCGEGGYESIDENTQQILARYFDIDPDKCEKEQQALLDALREDNKGR